VRASARTSPGPLATCVAIRPSSEIRNPTGVAKIPYSRESCQPGCSSTGSVRPYRATLRRLSSIQATSSPNPDPQGDRTIRECVEVQVAGVFAYLVKPFKEAELAPAIEIAIARYEEFVEIEKEVSDLENKLDTRKAVDRAKGILMDQYGLKEQDAFRRIQVQSMNTRKSMREIAEAIIIANAV